MFRDPSPTQPHRAEQGPQPRPGSAAVPSKLAIARRCIDAYNRRDLDAIASLAHLDIELDWTQSRSLRAGHYMGLDEVLRFYSEDFEMFETATIEPECLVEAGHTVVIPNVTRMRGRDGIEVASRSTLALTVVAGRVRHVSLHQSPL